MARRPGVGTVVHVSGFPEIPCRAAIVTGLDYGVGKEEALFANAFTHNPVAPVVPVVVSDMNNWHDLTDCPFEQEGSAAG